MKTAFFKVLAAVAFIGMTGCSSSSSPSASDAQRIFENKISNEAQGRIRLVSFQKTNGQMRQAYGVSVYHLEFQAEIEFTQNCRWLHNVDGSLSLRTSLAPANSLDLNAMMNTDPGQMMQAGAHQTINGAFDYEKTENGWRVN